MHQVGNQPRLYTTMHGQPVIKSYHHRFQRIEADIQLRTQFPSRNPPIRADELIETLLISWCDSRVWPSGTWVAFHVAVATAETRHPPPRCANISCLVSVNVQQASLNVVGYNFFCMDESSHTPLVHTHVHVRRHFARMPLCCHLSHGNKI